MAGGTPPLCGSLITSRRSFLALAWTLTTLLSFFSFGVSVFLGIKITNHYNSILTDEYAEWYRDEYGREFDNCRRYLEERNNNNNNEDRNNNNNREGGEQNNGQQQQQEHEQQREGCHSNDLDEAFFESLATTNSRGLVFAGVYTTVLGIALSLYGSTVVVGFMSAKGEYIPPCFSFRNMSVMIEDEREGAHEEDSTTGPRKLWGEKIHRGVFLGSLVIFSNLMLLCAVIFGELQVHDNYNNYYDEQQHHNLFSYRIEKISSVFAITCIVLAFVYILFAIIYTTCGGMSDDGDIYYDERRNWANYEMSTHHHTGRGGSGGGGGRDRLRHRSRRKMRNATDKQEPLMGSGMPPGAITDNEGFITDMVSTSSGSSMGSNPWEREKQFSGTLI